MFDGLRHKYTFKNICVENGYIYLEDGTNKVFLSTKGTLDDIPMPLKSFLDYIDGGVPEDDFIKEIDIEVDKVKHCDDWRREYMTLQIELDQRWRAGLAEGLAKGEARGRAEGETHGMLKTLYTLVKSNLLSIDKAAHQANMTEEEFLKMAETL